MIETPQKNSQSRGDKIKEIESDTEQTSPARKEKKVGTEGQS